MIVEIHLKELSKTLSGDLKWDPLSTTLYATDASVYRKVPVAVAFPKNERDIQILLEFCRTHGIGLIPRTAGTSLAGQCVGEGIVMDVSKYFTEILHFDEAKKEVTVQPGVIRDELNLFLKPYGLFFGPNTSTSNRCMIGGMVGNNSSGTTSIKYGVTREKIKKLKVILADGSTLQIGSVTNAEFERITQKNDTESFVYKELHKVLEDNEVQQNIINEFPRPEIHRRNTGYAVDMLLDSCIFSGSKPLELAQLLCGSEGTLAISTEITLALDDLPPTQAAMVVPHYQSLQGCLEDVAPLMQHSLYLCEMMDKVILDCTKNNRAQRANRFFVQGDPAAMLMLEVRATDDKALKTQIQEIEQTLEKTGKSYYHTVLYGADISKAIELRKAGLGLLGNMVGDKKAVACIEDTAVAVKDLSNFIAEFTEIMEGYGQSAVYYAHAGAGELHLRPILDLKKPEDVGLFRAITTDVARLTKKYKGSFSGEHGDGIVRAEFIPLMIGEKNYEILKKIKKIFDPYGILNPGKIVDAYPMDESLRYEPGREEPEITTLMDFSDSQGILRAAEKCNGSGDCRKTHQMDGAMCPSYQATKEEKHTTRGRANALREFLTTGQGSNPFDHEELKEVFDLCLSCKACASECPSNVDVASLKAEFAYQYQEKNGYSLRSRLFAYNTKINRLNSVFAPISNTLLGSGIFAVSIKKVFGVAAQRSLPKVHRFNFNRYLKAHSPSISNKQAVALYIDEFTQYMDVDQGRDAIDLLKGLGYEVKLLFGESGRTFISKGFLRQAKACAASMAEKLLELEQQNIPVLGLEPSALLTFRDEYKRLLPESAGIAVAAGNCWLIEEFLANEIQSGALSPKQFTKEQKEIKIHAHCHQKALSNTKCTFDMLNLPENYKVTIINAGCCGMAGSFGYEKEHYQVSMQVGELKLFPSVRKYPEDLIIAANGTSCRHQIYDGTGKVAKHPVSILKQALII